MWPACSSTSPPDLTLPLPHYPPPVTRPHSIDALHHPLLGADDSEHVLTALGAEPHIEERSEGDRVPFNPKHAIPVDLEGDNRLFVIPVEDIVAVFRKAE